MKVSVVVCTYADERFPDFCEAVESVLGQTYDSVEAVLVIDGNQSVFGRVCEEFGEREEVVIHCNEENQGVSASRTRGAELASGDVVAFIAANRPRLRAQTHWRRRSPSYCTRL